MTKRLILIRHAKSSWATTGLEDIARPLNDRGRNSAIALGGWLRQTGYLPDLILCSPAVRTRETVAGMELAARVDIVDALYLAAPETMLSVLHTGSGETVAMIGHNPGIAAFAALMVAAPPPHGRFADYPTGATLIVEFDVDDWAAVAPGTGQVRNFITPRELTGR